MRNGVALLGASLISFGLFWVMYQLVLGGEARRAEVTALPTIDFVRVQRQEALETRQRVRPERPPPPERPPTPPRINVKAQAPTAPAALDVPGQQALAVAPNLKGGPFIGEFTPAAAQYSDADLEARVQDARIVKAEPRGYFEQAALRSARQSQFRPRIVGGEPVTQTGTYDIVFTLESR